MQGPPKSKAQNVALYLVVKWFFYKKKTYKFQTSSIFWCSWPSTLLCESLPASSSSSRLSRRRYSATSTSDWSLRRHLLRIARTMRFADSFTNRTILAIPPAILVKLQFTYCFVSLEAWLASYRALQIANRAISITMNSNE